jgi:hypothetical protein
MAKNYSVEDFKAVKTYCDNLFKSKDKDRLFWKNVPFEKKLQALDELRLDLNELKLVAKAISL